MAKPPPNYYRAFRFTVGRTGVELGVQRVEVGPTADSLRIWRGISNETLPMFGELFPNEEKEFAIYLKERTGEIHRIYRYCYQRLVNIPVTYFHAEDSGPALEGIELQGVELVEVREVD